MVDEQENERDKRIRKNAEVSLTLSKLPPRMEAHEKKVAEQKTLGQGALSQSFSFRPPAPKPVPDFKRIHKEFAATLERNKSAAKLTQPTPFNFHEPKNDPSLRKHLDEDNQLINPTKKKKRPASHKLNSDLVQAPVANPPSTKKHEALVKLRRESQNTKL